LNDFPISLYFAAFLIHLELFLFSIFFQSIFSTDLFVIKYSTESRKNVSALKAVEKHIRRAKKTT